MKITLIASMLIVLLGAFMVGVQDAEAARFGGGRSFGSKPSMSQSAPASTVNRQATQGARPGAAAAAQTPKRGLLGGMGGMLGGLLAGSLLGSLLFGGGMGGGGGFLDLLLLGVLAFFAFRFFAKRRAQTPAAASPSGDMGTPQPQQNMFREAANSDAWSRLQDAPVQSAASWNGVPVPEGFDVDEFLRGAKLMYNRMQASWDARNLSDIAQFTTETVMTEVRRQFAEDSTPSTTEVLILNASLLGVETSAGEERAQVLFDANLREQGQGMTTQAREVWHFVRATSGNTMWRLDGIQQVDA